MKQRKQTNICLNMIVKNETRVLPRLLASVKEFIDFYVIVDTGSTDGTQRLIEATMKGYGIPGKIHDRQWVNFGVNRQQAMELAVKTSKCEWLLVIDADEELGVSDDLFYKNLKTGTNYSLEKHHGEMRYAVPNLINIRHSSWKWNGPVHEYLCQIEGAQNTTLLKDVWIIFHEGEGARSQDVGDEQKYLRDARLLEQHLKQNPDCSRSQFYLGQSYKDAGHYKKAISAYERRTKMDGWNEETFMAQLQIGRVARLARMPEEFVVSALLAAYEMRPSRSEPLYELARYYRLNKAYASACLFARAGLAIARPADRLFVSQNVYDWRLHDELAVSAYWCENYEDTISACRNILSKNSKKQIRLNVDEVRRVQANLGFARQKLRQAQH